MDKTKKRNEISRMLAYITGWITAHSLSQWILQEAKILGKVFSLLLVKVWSACEACLSGLGIGNWHHEQGWDYLWRVGIVLRGNPRSGGLELICSALLFPLLCVMLVTWKRQWWKYLQHRNWQKLQILGPALPLNWLSACYLNISKAY